MNVSVLDNNEAVVIFVRIIFSLRCEMVCNNEEGRLQDPQTLCWRITLPENVHTAV